MSETLNMLVTFIFIGGTLLFLFGAMIQGNNNMWLPSLIFFILACYFAVKDDIKPQTTDSLRES